MTKGRISGLLSVIRITCMALETASYETLVFVFPSVLLSAIVMQNELYSYVYSYRSKYIFHAKHTAFSGMW